MHTPEDPSQRVQETHGRAAGAPPHITPEPRHSAGMDAAEAERRSADWAGIAAMPAFSELIARKKRFIISGTVFFLAYYFALPVLVGWFPEWMDRRVGAVNVAYLFALSQFGMAWIVAAIYVKVAAGWDRSAQAIIEQTGRK